MMNEEMEGGSGIALNGDSAGGGANGLLDDASKMSFHEIVKKSKEREVFKVRKQPGEQGLPRYLKPKGSPHTSQEK